MEKDPKRVTFQLYYNKIISTTEEKAFKWMVNLKTSRHRPNFDCGRLLEQEAEGKDVGVVRFWLGFLVDSNPSSSNRYQRTRESCRRKKERFSTGKTQEDCRCTTTLLIKQAKGAHASAWKRGNKDAARGPTT